MRQLVLLPASGPPWELAIFRPASYEPIQMMSSRPPILMLSTTMYECLPLSCPRYGTEMRLLALPGEPPQIVPARDPPLDELDSTPAFNPADPEPVPVHEFDQTVSW